MSKTLALFALLLIAPLAQAELRDPQGLLSQIRAFSGTRPFAEAFHCGDVARLDLFRLSCEFVLDSGATISTCYDVGGPKGIPVQRTVYNCTPDSISILLDLTGGSGDLLRSDYEHANSSTTETFLENAASFAGYPVNIVTLTDIQTVSYTLDADTGHPRTVPALNVIGELGEKEYRVPMLITVVQGVPGVAEVARFRTDVKTWFKLTGFQRSPQ